ncbi:cyclophilin-like fold protein [Serinibacter arcticus]|uniref:cyclophilin-like fold protein n=1 Tax=Serinibacter arcticus TaxID=1655435 RepID=UPI0018EE99C9|nr:cyclophilin-like fold protein [Serinibacter arcticus]
MTIRVDGRRASVRCSAFTLLTGLLALGACTAGDGEAPAAPSSSPTVLSSPGPTALPSPPPSAPAQTTPPTPESGETVPEPTGTAVTLTIGEQRITATLNDSPAARALAQQLPLTLAFDDFNAVEKIARLETPLPMAGMPPGDDPEIADIGFYAPSGDLVLYYGDVGYYTGIARLGTFDDVAAIEAMTGPFTVVVAPA